MNANKAPAKARIGLFYAVVALFWMSVYAYQPILSVYSSQIGASASMVGSILGSYGLTQLILRIPLGIVSDKLGKRKIFVILGAVLGGVSAIGLWSAKTPVMLMIFRGLAGCAASTWVTSTVLFSSYFDADSAPKAMAKITVFNNLGQIIAMISGGQIAQYLGNRAAFILACSFGVIGFVLALFVTETKIENRKGVTVKDLLSVGLDKQLLSVSFIGVLFQIINQGALLGFSPTFAKELGATAGQLGMLTSISVGGMMVTSYLTSNFILQKWGAKRCIMTGQIITGTALILLPIVSKTVWVLFIFQFLAGLGNGLNYPLLMGLAIKNIDSQRRGAAMGFFQSIYALGMYLGPVIIGALSEVFTVGMSLSIIGVTAYIACLCTLVLINKNA
ncbi:MAG: MFS transporter [Clostridiales bacterium]|nr:MFS transporter [Clostridiales bacterium]MBQ4638242.1 MFS transporter [Clostridia bacterium]